MTNPKICCHCGSEGVILKCVKCGSYYCSRAECLVIFGVSIWKKPNIRTEMYNLPRGSANEALWMDGCDQCNMQMHEYF
jgi:hypothetical protein